MNLLVDSFWRAAMYCVHPRVVLWSLLPLFVAGGLCAALSYFFWEPALDGVQATLESFALVKVLLEWLDGVGAGAFRAVLAPLVLVALAVPVIVVLSMLMVALMMTPAVVALVAQRRFPALERKRGASFFASVSWSLGCTLVAFVLLVFSIPFWFVPPLILVLPPLIWGWLTYRVMSFDALAEHASATERSQLFREHRWRLVAIGVITGYLGAAPSLVWAVSAAWLILAPLLVLAAVWIYTLVFAFATLWFTHFLLAALDRLRASDRAADGSVQASVALSAGPPPPALPAP